VAFLASSVDPNGPRFVEQTRAAAQKLGIHLQPVFVRGAEDFESAFSRLLQERPEALIVQPIFNEQRRRIVDFAARHRLLTMSDQKTFAEAGGLIAYGASRTEQYRRAAVQVVKILRGAKPADLPVEEPTRFELVINLKTAKVFGLTIPPTVLLQADQVIE
jgi:putative tryptophan/tyrosine transport system substrate-binding protein